MDFDELYAIGRDVEERWRAASYHEDALPAIASARLEQVRGEFRFDARATAEWLLEPGLRRVRLAPGEFSDLPLVLYSGTHLLVHLLVWSEGTADIHQHSFSGAFRLMQGSSIQSLYSVRGERWVNDDLQIVDARLAGLELLRPGAVRPILAGAALTHAVFHLDRPTVTLVARSRHAALAGPQPVLVSPRLALSYPSRRDQGQTDALVRVLGLADATGEPELLGLATGVLSRLDFPRALEVMLRGWEFFRRARASVGEAVAAAHPAYADLLPGFFAELERVRQIKDARAKVRDREGRLVLAAMLLCPDRPTAMSILVPEFGPAEADRLWSLHGGAM